MNPLSSFVLSLLATLLVVRAWTFIFQDHTNYRTPHEKSLTPTGYLRRKTGKDIHHYHLSIPILCLSFLLLIISSFRSFNYSIFGIGLSLFVDQVAPMFFKVKVKNYFTYKHFFISVLAHLLIAISVLTFALF